MKQFTISAVIISGDNMSTKCLTVIFLFRVITQFKNIKFYPRAIEKPRGVLVFIFLEFLNRGFCLGFFYTSLVRFVVVNRWVCSTGCICTAEGINYARPAADTVSLAELYDSCIRRNVGHA